MALRDRRGFSLLEMLVALSIHGLVLGTLYRAATGATRNVAVAERYSYAVLLAESLLADHGAALGPGASVAGDSGGFRWQVSGQPLERETGDPVELQRLTATVRWEGGGDRQVQLVSYAPLREVADL